MKRNKIILYSLFLFFFVKGNAQNPYTNDSVKEKLETALENFENDRDLRHATFGFCLYEPKKEKLITSRHKDVSLIPASTTKLITTGAALALLGKDFTFKTYIQYTGKLTQEGVLYGDLYVIGGGDPTLGSGKLGAMPLDSLLADVVEAIMAKGISQIKGKIIADVSMFKGEEDLVPANWTWQDMGNHYAASPSALTVDGNTYEVKFKTGTKKGDSTHIINVTPDGLEDVELINNVTTAEDGSEDNAYIYASPSSKKRYVAGTLPANKDNFIIKGSIPNPPKLFTEKLKIALEKRCVYTDGGVEIRTKNTSQETKEKKKNILTIESPPLYSIVSFINETSSNLYAEHLLKTIGYVKAGDGSTAAGIDIVMKYLQKINFDTEGFQYADGSGLSRTNVVTTFQQVKYLSYYMKQPNFKEFYGSLPIAGQTGTLKKMFKEQPAEGKIRAKTGTLSNVKAWAGYVTTEDGKTLCFSFVINNFSCSITELKKKVEIVLNNLIYF